MLRSLGIISALKWFLLVAVGLAVWRGFNGDLSLIAHTAWDWVQKGADVVTNIWDSINKK